MTSSGFSATITGDSNSCTLGSGSSATVSGTGEVLSGTGAIFTLDPNSTATVNGSSDQMTIGSGSSVQAFASTSNFTVDSGATVTSTGDGDNFSAGWGVSATFNVNGTNENFSVDDSTINVQSQGCTDGIHCQGDTINAQSDDTIDISGDGQSGAADTVNMSSGTVDLSSNANAIVDGSTDNVTVGGDDTVSVTGAGMTIDATGTGDILDAAGATIDLGADTSATISGAGDTVDAQQGDVISESNATIDVASGDTVTVTGTNDVINATGATVDLGANTYATVEGSSDGINLSAGDTLAAVGGGNTIDGGAGECIYVANTGAAGDAINASGDQFGTTTAGDRNSGVILGSDAFATVEGASDGVYMTSGDTVAAVGGGNTIDGGAGECIYVANTSAAGDTINASGDQFGTTTAGDRNSGVILGSDAFATVEGASDEVWVGGSQDTINASNDSIWDGDAGITKTLVNGNSDTINVDGAGDTLEATGTGDFTDVAGAYDHIDSTGLEDGVGLYNTGDVSVATGAYDRTLAEGSYDQTYDSGYEDFSANYGVYDATESDGVGDSTADYGYDDFAGDSGGYGGGYSGGYGYGFAGSKAKIAKFTGANIGSIAAFDLQQGNNSAVSELNEAFGEVKQAIAGDDGSAVLEGAKWDQKTVTWSIANPGGDATANAADVAAAQQAFAAWSSVTGLNFQEVSGSSAADIQIEWSNLDTSSTGVVGLTHYQANAGAMQSAVIKLEDPAQDALVSGAGGQLSYSGTDATLRQVLLHEIGHAIGFADNAGAHSIMSYYLGGENRRLSAADASDAEALYGQDGQASGSPTSAASSLPEGLKQAIAAFDAEDSAPGSNLPAPPPTALAQTLAPPALSHA